MKKLLPTVVLSAFFYASIYAATCYDTWTVAYETANQQYQSDLNRCDGAFFRPQYCYDEAEASYTQNLNTAGDDYYCCVHSC